MKLQIQILLHLALAGSTASQGAFVLHGPKAKALARNIERELPKPLPCRLYNAGLLALADKEGRAKMLARINSARVLVLADHHAAKLLGDEKLTVPVITLDTPATGITTNGGSITVWSQGRAPADPKPKIVSDLDRFSAPDPSAHAVLTVKGGLTTTELAAACLVEWIPELRRPVLIVHAKNPVKDMSKTFAIRLLRMRRQHWLNGQRVRLLLPPQKSHAFRELLRVVYKTDARSLQRRWSELQYTHKITAIPRHMPSAAAAIVLVARRRRALSVVRASAIPRHADIRVLTIDGRSFASKEYLFR